MEEARSLEPRRVTLEFLSQRMAEDILAVAFERLTRDVESIHPAESSVQHEQDAVEQAVRFCEGAMR